MLYCFVTNPKNLLAIFLYYILITANMQSKTGFPSSHQLKSYVAPKSRLKFAARCPVSSCWPSCWLRCKRKVMTLYFASQSVCVSNRSQALVGRSSPYYEDMWRRYCCLTSFFSHCRYASVSLTCLFLLLPHMSTHHSLSITLSLFHSWLKTLTVIVLIGLIRMSDRVT